MYRTGSRAVPHLIHVDGLQVSASGEDDGVVLVLWLALAQHGVAGELHAVHLPTHRPTGVTRKNDSTIVSNEGMEIDSE